MVRTVDRDKFLVRVLFYINIIKCKENTAQGTDNGRVLLLVLEKNGKLLIGLLKFLFGLQFLKLSPMNGLRGKKTCVNLPSGSRFPSIKEHCPQLAADPPASAEGKMVLRYCFDMIRVFLSRSSKVERSTNTCNSSVQSGVTI